MRSDGPSVEAPLSDAPNKRKHSGRKYDVEVNGLVHTLPEEQVKG